jgi:hypothetical protein
MCATRGQRSKSRPAPLGDGLMPGDAQDDLVKQTGLVWSYIFLASEMQQGGE